jgi:CheY-like chemotaxis protein
MIPIAGCGEPAAIEERIRAAWTARQTALRSARARLASAGAEAAWEAGGAVLSVGLGVEDKDARARLLDATRVVLPGRGPLSGRPLPQAGDRLFPLGSGWESGTDLEIAITNRLEALGRAQRREEERRWTIRAHRRPAEDPTGPTRPTGLLVPRHRILLVGPHLAADEALQRDLRREGYVLALARSSSDALSGFTERSFDVVLAETVLGRGEGIELIPEIHALPGVAQLPVVLVDDRMRPSRKEAARQVGAAGYLVRPVRAAAIARGLARMARGARGRRYVRYPCRLAVRFAGGEEPAFTTAVSRLGMFVRTEEERPGGARHGSERIELALPELSRTLRVDAEPLYRAAPSSALGAGMGLRFLGFPDGSEAEWIAYLRSLSPAGRALDARQP